MIPPKISERLVDEIRHMLEPVLGTERMSEVLGTVWLSLPIAVEQILREEAPVLIEIPLPPKASTDMKVLVIDALDAYAVKNMDLAKADMASQVHGFRAAHKSAGDKLEKAGIATWLSDQMRRGVAQVRCSPKV